MSVKQCLNEYSEQNWQVDTVAESEKKALMEDINETEAKEKDMGGFGDEKSVLENRVQSLKQAISALKLELLEEKALWKKEVEFMAGLISSSNAETDANSEAETETKSSVSVSPIPPPESVASAPLIKDFEEKLSRYQGALAQAHAEKRFNIRRQIAANTYRKRLYEVEKLCQEELNKVRETATYLEPLKQMASEWNRLRPQQHGETHKCGGFAGSEKKRSASLSGVECGGDFLQTRDRGSLAVQEEHNPPYEVPVKQIDASLVMDEDASSEIKGKIVLQIGSLPSEVPTICYSAKFE